MSINSALKVFIMATIIVMSCNQAEARRHHHISRPGYVVITPRIQCKTGTKQSGCHFSRQERLSMAIAYLENHKSLTIRQYCKITSLKKAAAEAELDAFVLDSTIPILSVIDGKKKVYVKDYRYQW